MRKRPPSSALALRLGYCEAADVEPIKATEQPGARIAELLFARQERGESLFLVAWLDGVPVGSGEVVLAAPRELRNLHVMDAYRGRASREATRPDA